MDRYKKVKKLYKSVRNDICNLIDKEIETHSTYYYQKKGIGSVSLNNVKNPELREKLGLDTILRIYEKMIEGE
jgi:hypothetical protein